MEVNTGDNAVKINNFKKQCKLPHKFKNTKDY